MKSSVESFLSATENRLAAVGLPAGADRHINRNVILGVILGALGALPGWLLSEPWREDFSLLREYPMWLLPALGIRLLVLLKDAALDARPILAAQKALRPAWFAPLILLAAAGGAELIAYMGGTQEGAKETLKVFVLDVSGSMQGRPMETLKKAVERYVETLQKQKGQESVSLACVAFSDNARVVSPPTKDRAAFLAEVRKMGPTGQTNMGAGLIQAKDIIVNPEFGGRASEVILVSDGKPNLPLPDPLKPIKEVGADFREHKVTLYTVGAGSDYQRDLLEHIAKMTDRGEFFPADNIDRLVSVFEEIASRPVLSAQEPLGMGYRLAAWGLVGLAIGLCLAIPRGTGRAFAFGAGGGVAGGFLAALLFSALMGLMGFVGITSGVLGRLLGFSLLGVSVGLGYTFAETISRPAWIRVRSGDQRGRIFTLDRPETALGSAVDADITITGDPEIIAQHAKFLRSGKNVTIESIGGAENIKVKGVAQTSVQLNHGDSFTVGGTEFTFLNELNVIGGTR